MSTQGKAGLQSASATTDHSAKAKREVRIGLVLYGGISLAIYIYGVAYEFWRLVQASRRYEEKATKLEPNAYERLLEKAEATATVDVVSGASAGGINGVLLAKALTTGADFDACRSLWVDRGDFAALLRDPGEREPRSLLRSELFDELLLSGLAEMDRVGTGERLVEVLDLFAPATRLRGWVRTYVDDLGQAVQTRDYRKVFNLKFRHAGYIEGVSQLGYSQNDFARGMNEVLAEVARATSAFPFAFEPKLISRRDTDVRFGPDEPSSEYFSDGGILHNRPFTEAISTIRARASDRPVTRWLLSVEPDPEHFAAQLPPGPTPEVIEVVSKALVGIPRYQSIAADLDRLDEHRANVKTTAQFITGVENALRVMGCESPKRRPRRDLLLPKAYGPLRRGEVKDDLVSRLVDCSGLEPTDEPDVEYGLGKYAESVGKSLEKVLDGIDVKFQVRRIYYMLERLTRESEKPEVKLDASKLADLYNGFWAVFDRARHLWWEVLRPESEAARSLAGLKGASLEAISKAVVGVLGTSIVPKVKEGINELQEEARAVAVEAEKATGVPFSTIFDRYELWDMFILPIERIAGVRAREEISFARISPYGATYVRKPPEDKLAGDALGHFGGFLKRDWRRNDILWGRLDAAEVIVRVLLTPRFSEPDQRRLIHEIQDEIAKAEIPDLLAEHPGLDYRTYLEQKHTVGAETVADVAMQDRANLVLRGAEVFRNMLRRLQNADLRHGLKAQGLSAVFRVLGRGLGFVLFLVRWPVLAVWGRDIAVRRFLTLLVSAAALWAVATLILIFLPVINSPSRQLLTFIVLALLVFGVYVSLLGLARWAVFRLRRRAGPSSTPVSSPPGFAYAELAPPGVADPVTGTWRYSVKQGDTVPPLCATLRHAQTPGQRADGAEGDPIDLSGAQVHAAVSPVTGGTAKTGACTVTNARHGQVEYCWEFEDTAADGSYRLEFIVNGANGLQTIPGSGYIELFVEESPTV